MISIFIFLYAAVTPVCFSYYYQCWKQLC